MVFISLEGFLEVNANEIHTNGKLPGSTSPVRTTPQLPQAAVHVVVTPGSPAKPSAAPVPPSTSAGQKRSRLRRAASSFSSFSTATRRPSNDHSPPSTGATTATASTQADQFVLYVTDRDIHHKWVLAKTPIDYLQFKKDLQGTLGSCRQFACCGPLRRIVSSSQYNKPKRRWSDSRVVAQFVHSNVIQEYINDLLLAVLGRDADCESTKQAWAVVNAFLDVEKQRADVADRIVLGTIGDAHCPHQQMRRSQSEGATSRRPSILIDHAPIVLSDSEAASPAHESMDEGEDHDAHVVKNATPATNECPICCCSLTAEGKTSRLLCGHRYHADCVRVWLRMQHTCPVCRIPIEGV